MTGWGRRVQIIELTNGIAYATNKFVWDGTTLCEQRDFTGTNVTKRFFGEGEQVSGAIYFFTRDHLGSVREVMNTAGVMQARYDYDPYGRMTVTAGSFNADFGYAGMYYHAASGLNLTLYRAYDSDLGRWLSRDPIQELGGLDLYAYVMNNPIRYLDSLGLAISSDPNTDNCFISASLWWGNAVRNLLTAAVIQHPVEDLVIGIGFVLIIVGIAGPSRQALIGAIADAGAGGLFIIINIEREKRKLASELKGKLNACVKCSTDPNAQKEAGQLYQQLTGLKNSV